MDSNRCDLVGKAQVRTARRPELAMARGHRQEQGADVTDDRELSLLDAAVQHDAEAQSRIEEALQRAQRSVRRERQAGTPTQPMAIPEQPDPE